MEKKVEVRILNQPFTFIGEDEERIKRVAGFVDERVAYVLNNHGLVNTMNAVIMAMMELSDEYLHHEGAGRKLRGPNIEALEKG